MRHSAVEKSREAAGRPVPIPASSTSGCYAASQTCETSLTFQHLQIQKEEEACAAFFGGASPIWFWVTAMFTTFCSRMSRLRYGLTERKEKKTWNRTSGGRLLEKRLLGLKRLGRACSKTTSSGWPAATKFCSCHGTDSDRVIALMKKLLQAKEIKTRRNVRFGHGNEIQTKRAVVRAFPSSVFCGGLPRGVSKRGKDSKTTRKKISGGRRDGEGPGG